MSGSFFTRLKEGLRKTVFRWLSRSRFLSALYYTIASNAFVREQRAVLYGKHCYYENLVDPTETQYLLRRNIHRLEKGLLMRPRRDTFATGYITETTKAYQQAVKKQNADDIPNQAVPIGDLQWASDVLEKYFAVTANGHSVIDKARSVFASVPALKTTRGPTDGLDRLIPYHRELSGVPPVSYEALYRLSRRRRSVRWFLDKLVPQETLDNAIQIAAQAPSACNRQPFHFRIFNDPDEATRIARLAAGTKGYVENIPAIIVIVGHLRAYFAERDRHVIYIDGSLAAMSLMFALETLGLSSCPINWSDIEEREKQMAEALNLEPDERPIMLLAVGYPDPDGKVAASKKKSINSLRSYESFE